MRSGTTWSESRCSNETAAAIVDLNMQMDWVPAAIVELNQYPEQHFAPSVFRDRRGQVVATCGRTEEGVLISRSADGGLNWTRPQALEVPGRTEGLLGSTRSGRLLWIICESTEPENHAAGQVTSELVGEAPRGRGIWRHSGYCVARMALKTWYSDDEGRTWQGGGRADISPLLTGYPFRRPVELADGTLLLNVYGYFAPEEMDRIAISSCVLRSTDHGATWGALQIVGRAAAWQRVCATAKPA